MKRILLLLLLFVNLQIVFYNGILDCSFTSVYAQHMTREAGDNCYDSEIGWYHSPFSDCRDVDVTPSCQYCGTNFNTDLARREHEKDCPSIPKAYNCSYCNEGFDDFADCCNHEENCPDRFKCSICGNKFTSQQAQTSHQCGGQNNQGGGGQTGGGSTGGGPVVGGGSTVGSKGDGDTPTINLPEVVVKGFKQRDQYLVQKHPWSCVPTAYVNSLYTLESSTFTSVNALNTTAEDIMNEYDKKHSTDIRNNGIPSTDMKSFFRDQGQSAQEIEISKAGLYLNLGVSVIGILAVECDTIKCGHAVAVIGADAINDATVLTVINSNNIENHSVSEFVKAYYFKPLNNSQK